jgi:hypothetical protein
MNNKLRIPYGYKFSYFVDEDEYVDFVYENGTEDKIIWREYKKDIVVIKEPSKQELQQRIDKAIHYIEYDRDDDYYVDELLKILKGSDK